VIGGDGCIVARVRVFGCIRVVVLAIVHFFSVCRAVLVFCQ
jgi:hypothetical protein